MKGFEYLVHLATVTCMRQAMKHASSDYRYCQIESEQFINYCLKRPVQFSLPSMSSKTSEEGLKDRSVVVYKQRYQYGF